jgi:aminoglycoside phosphotransferase (APT) family kinase protein
VTRFHDDEIAVDRDLVRALLGDLRPEWAALPVERLATTGSSNALFRVGEHLLARLPRQPDGGTTIEKEVRWLPYVGAALPVPVSQVVAVGGQGRGYPERWSVVRWIDGEHPSVVGDLSHDPDTPDRTGLARDLAAVVVALRSLPVPDEALADPALRWYRGLPLVTRDADTRQSLEACRAIDGLGIDLDAAAAVWDEAMTLPGAEVAVAPRWYHGDLAAENLLVRHGRLAAVLDFGALSVGDPTVDLIPAWEVLDPSARAAFRDAVAVDDATWLRGRAWALSLAVMTFPYYWETMPGRCASRQAVVRAVLADAGLA